jgi:beta-glucosidase
LKLSIPVSNTGKRNGTEIVQVYVRKVNDTDGPTKTLRGFQRLEVPAGKTSQAIITLPYNAFEFFDRSTGSMKVMPGEYEIWYGNSSAAKDLKTVKIKIG